MRTLQHVDERHHTLTQAEAFKSRHGFALLFGLRFGLRLRIFFFFDRCTQGVYRLQHVMNFDDAFGTRLFANDGQDLFALRLQHDDVTRGFGFEFIEHGDDCARAHSSLSMQS